MNRDILFWYVAYSRYQLSVCQDMLETPNQLSALYDTGKGGFELRKQVFPDDIYLIPDRSKKCPPPICCARLCIRRR